MAAQKTANPRKRPAATAPRVRAAARRSAEPARPHTPLVRAATSLTRRVVRLELSERLRSELLALASATLALLLMLALLGLDHHLSLAGLAARVLRALFGRASYIVPVGFVWLALETLAGEASHRRRRAVGVALLDAALLAYVALIADSRAAGLAGTALSWALRLIAGDLGAVVLLLSLAVAGIYLTTGAGLRYVWQAYREDCSRRAAARAERLRRRQAARSVPPTSALEVEPPPEDTAQLPGVEPARPVIKVPQRSRAANGASGTPFPSGPLPLPAVERLALYEGGLPDEGELEIKAQRIAETLANFKVDAHVREVYPGPAVTLFALEPGPGVKVKRITELQNDLALTLAARSIRIEAPVPGKARVGIEIPNSSVHTVGLRETIEAAEFAASAAKLPLALGRDVNGDYIIADLAKMPHLLIAGSTGSGKSVCINGIIGTFLLTSQPEDLQMVLIDPKMVELVGYNGVPHLKCPVVTEMDKVVGTLRLVVKEMEERYQRFSNLGVRNIDGYRLKREEDPSLDKLPYLVVIIDELADLMMTTPEEVETLLVRLAQMARATGIHLLIATQRPSVDVLTGLIKTNVPARIAFAVTSLTDSRVILDLPGAERLLGKGDMLFLPPDAAKPQRVQGSYIDDKDLQYVVRHWRKVVPDYGYDPGWEVLGEDEAAEGGVDPLMEQALKVVRQHGTASASMLQRRLRIGYNRASRLIEQMEDEGIVGPSDGAKGRPVLLDVED